VRVTALRVTEVVICAIVPLTGLHNVPANTMLGGCVLALCTGTTPSWTTIVLDSTCTPIALTFEHVSCPAPTYVSIPGTLCDMHNSIIGRKPCLVRLSTQWPRRSLSAYQEHAYRVLEVCVKKVCKDAFSNGIQMHLC
jgi:hypothetical protein